MKPKPIKGKNDKTMTLEDVLNIQPANKNVGQNPMEAAKQPETYEQYMATDPDAEEQYYEYMVGESQRQLDEVRAKKKPGTETEQIALAESAGAEADKRIVEGQSLGDMPIGDDDSGDGESMGAKPFTQDGLLDAVQGIQFMDSTDGWFPMGDSGQPMIISESADNRFRVGIEDGYEGFINVTFADNQTGKEETMTIPNDLATPERIKDTIDQLTKGGSEGGENSEFFTQDELVNVAKDLRINGLPVDFFPIGEQGEPEVTGYDEDEQTQVSLYETYGNGLRVIVSNNETGEEEIIELPQGKNVSSEELQAAIDQATQKVGNR